MSPSPPHNLSNQQQTSLMKRRMTTMLPSSLTHTQSHTCAKTDALQQLHTFMRKKSSRMTKTLTSGCSQAVERPRPTGEGDPEIFVHVKLSNKELMHSLGISWGGDEEGERQQRNETDEGREQISARKKKGIRMVKRLRQMG